MNRYKFDDKNHVHLLDNKPLIGTSTIAGSVGKGSALSWWASSKACETLGWIKKEYAPDDKYKKNCINEDERIKSALNVLKNIKSDYVWAEEYLELLDTAYKAHSKELKRTADKGVDLHAILESYVKDQILLNNKKEDEVVMEEYDMRIETFIDWSKNNVKKWLFSEVHVYSEELWTGGIVDAAYIDKNNEFVIADFKSGGAWMSGFIQIGGYARQLIENMGAFDENGNRVWGDSGTKIPDSLAIFPFKGGFKEPVIIRGQTMKYMKGFECAVYNYKLQQEFEKR